MSIKYQKLFLFNGYN